MAKLLRQWLDRVGMRVDDVLSSLTPEHFADGRVPGRSTVADRLAGLGLRQDFVEAMADICSPNTAARARLLAQAEDVRRRTRAVRGGDGAGAASADAQLVMVQQRSIEVSDKLLRALERAAQLERERNDANQMVLVLLAMVDKLQRDISTLARERDRLRTSSSVEAELEQVHGRLSRSEQQRATAEAELERARAERQKADQLAEEAAQQVRQLTEELERLRGEVPDSADAPEPAAGAPVLHDALDDGADDIDMALAKATRHLDDSADRLDQLASELHLDNPSDNPPTLDDVTDNSPDNPQISGSDDVDLTPEQVVAEIRALVSEGGAEDRAEVLLQLAGQTLPVIQVMHAAVMLRDANLPDEAAHLLSDAMRRTPLGEVPGLVSALRGQGHDAELYQLLTQVAQSWPASDIVEVMTCLRDAKQDSDAYQVLSAVGRDCPPVEVLKVLARLNDQDADWVLDAACRDRPVKELPDLQAALSNLRSTDASKVATAYSQRKEDFGVIEPAELPTDFEAFFSRHKSEFIRVAGAGTRNPHDADEVLMEAALVMYRKWERILAHPNPIALAHRILENAIADFYRRLARTADREVSYGELTYADVPTADDLILLRGHGPLDRALAELEQRAPVQANCVRLRYFTELDFADIATRLNITPGAAKTNVHLGLKNLNRLIGLPDPGKRAPIPGSGPRRPSRSPLLLHTSVGQDVGRAR
ncbi:sigma factor-like helix-turn-helix DNA-binding protein [Streptomyces sp. NPDC056165]|uniref:RNA polymerase sigma factor n=1 Tax=Streptomyces sp. NPDC056165 TaxID=3345733 RepID=UPI0035DF601D